MADKYWFKSKDGIYETKIKNIPKAGLATVKLTEYEKSRLGENYSVIIISDIQRNMESKNA